MVGLGLWGEGQDDGVRAVAEGQGAGPGKGAQLGQRAVRSPGKATGPHWPSWGALS